MKAAIFVLADPKGGSEEASGRVFNAMAAAHDFKQRGGDVTIVFQGAGTRWPSILTNKEHPFHGLYEMVKDKVAGVSCGCAEVFGASDGAKSCGLPMMTDSEIPGTPGLASFAKLASDGYTVLTF